MVSLKLKLLSFLLYLLSSVYIFIKFVNSLPKPWLNKTGYTNKIGYTDGIGWIGYISYRVSKVKVRVSVVVYKVEFLVVLILVLALAKLFLRR
jgi:membrane associated rhomboid family serine protease